MRIAGRRLDHVRRVHRASVGDVLCVGLLNDRLGAGRVTRIDGEALEMDVVLESDPPPALPVTVVLALPRPLVLKRVLLSACALGVKRLVLVNGNRVEGSFWQSTALAPDALRHQLVLGLEQARDTRLPEVLLRRGFKPFVEEELPALAAGTRCLAAHPEGVRPCPRQVAGAVTLAIGPEGGFVRYELEKLEACGFETVHLGARVLRVESALPALLGRLF